jgi:flagellar biosynthesis protein FlhB
MAALRFGSFVPNKIGLVLAVTYIIFFIVYMVGYTMFNSSYHALYEEEEYRAIQSMKWFLVGCPVVILLAAIFLFIVSSFDSRQILLGVRNLVT